MLKTNRGKRKSSDEHDGRATVPHNDAMEFEEVVATGHKGSSAGVDDNVERSDLRYIAWLLREKLIDFVDGDPRESGVAELKLQSLFHLVASRKIVSVDPKMLSPVLWRTLPQELLLRVLARLPLPDITRLRSLSKEWNRDMATVNSEINRACDETNPIVVAGLSRRENSIWFYHDFFVKICAQKLQYSYRLEPGDPIIRESGWYDMGAVDHGLVCFVSIWKPSKDSRMCIVVANLLTRVWRELPPRHYVYLSPPEMMHIKVDSETKCYKVVVVDKNRKGRPVVEIYDSGARQWTKATPPLGSIFGFAHTWDYNTYDCSFRSTSSIRSVYDFAEERLKRYDEEGPSGGASVIVDAHYQDCMFVLDRNTSSGDFFPAEGYCIISIVSKIMQRIGYKRGHTVCALLWKPF